MSSVLKLQRLVSAIETPLAGEYLMSTFSGVCPILANDDQGTHFQVG